MSLRILALRQAAHDAKQHGLPGVLRPAYLPVEISLEDHPDLIGFTQRTANSDLIIPVVWSSLSRERNINDVI